MGGTYQAYCLCSHVAKARLSLINCNSGGLLVDNRGSGPVLPRLRVFFESIIERYYFVFFLLFFNNIIPG